MLFNRKKEIKQSTLNPSLKHTRKIFSHPKIKSATLLEKKPHILLMKWNHFLEKYHHLKQLNDINGSLISIGIHLRKKKEDPEIRDVPFIESQQISFNELEDAEESFIVQEQENDHIHLPNQLKATIKTKGSVYCQETLEGSRVNKSKSSQKGSKMGLSIKQQESEMIESSKKQLSKGQNFTDEENDLMQQKKQSRKRCEPNRPSFSIAEKPRQVIQVFNQEVSQEMIKTACFSSVSYTQNPRPSLNISSANNQQNINLSNHFGTSKNIDALTKIQTDQQKRRQRARQIIKEDQEYLRKLMAKK